MAYNYEYPYTDPNRYNADWLLNKMKELEGRLDGIVEETLALTKTYVDNRLETYQSQINNIRQEIAELSQRTDTLSAHVAEEVLRLEAKILDAERKAESLFIIANNRTDLQIERNNEYIFREIEDNILANITVINYFTGERMTVQGMFDYLASLHAENAITYNGLRDKNLTYTELIAKSISYTELVKNGSTLL
jgi:uncharacterized protein YoxC